MKKNFLFLLCLIISFSSFSQVLTQDLLEQPKKPKGEFISYISKNGAEYKLGDKVMLGSASQDKQFAFVMKGSMITAVLCPSSLAGIELEIKKIWPSGTKKTGFYAIFTTKGPYHIIVEQAIEHAELDGYGMTEDEALAALKKAKDKLDLEIITKLEYDQIKSDLMKYIK